MKYFIKSSIVIIGFAFLQCSDPSYPPAEPSNIARYAKVMFINASPDAPSLVFQVDNAQVATLNPQNSSGYINVNASSEQFKVKNATFGVVGSDTLAQQGDLQCKAVSNSIIVNTQVSLTGGSYYTIITTDSINRPHAKKSSFSQDQGGLQMLNSPGTVISDNLAISASNAGVRFYNLAPGSPKVYLSNSGSTTGLASALTGGNTYKAYSGTFSTVTPGSYNLTITANSVSDPTVLAKQSVVLAPGKAYTIFLTGKVNSLGTVKVAYALNVVQHN